MKSLKHIFCILVVFSMICAMIIPVSAATSGTVTFNISPESVKVGDTFTVTMKYVPGGGSSFKGGTYLLDFDDTVATLESEESPLNNIFSMNILTNNAAKHIYAVKHLAGAKDDWVSLSKEGVFSVMTFKAVAEGTFAINAKGTGGATFAQADNSDRVTVKGNTLTGASVVIAADKPEPTKYTVKFVDGEKEVSSVEYEEGATIVAPKDPTPAIGKAFDGWYNGEEKFAEGTTATANVTYTAKYVDVAADAPTTAVKSEGYEDAAGYTNVWVGRYTATPAANTVLKTFGVAYGEKTFDKENLVEGGATVEFSVALVGVPTDVTLTGAPFATADWAK